MVHYINELALVLSHVQILKSKSPAQARCLKGISLSSPVAPCLCMTRLQGSSGTTWVDIPPVRGYLCSASAIWTMTDHFSLPWGPQHVSFGQVSKLSLPGPSIANAETWRLLAVIHLSPQQLLETGQISASAFLLGSINVSPLTIKGNRSYHLVTLPLLVPSRHNFLLGPCVRRSV